MNNLTLGNAGFSYYETIGGGQGACADADGPSGVHVAMSNTLNTPVEALERAYPLRVRPQRATARVGRRGPLQRRRRGRPRDRGARAARVLADRGAPPPSAARRGRRWRRRARHRHARRPAARRARRPARSRPARGCASRRRAAAGSGRPSGRDGNQASARGAPHHQVRRRAWRGAPARSGSQRRTGRSAQRATGTPLSVARRRPDRPSKRPAALRLKSLAGESVGAIMGPPGIPSRRAHDHATMRRSGPAVGGVKCPVVGAVGSGREA